MRTIRIRLEIFPVEVDSLFGFKVFFPTLSAVTRVLSGLILVADRHLKLAILLLGVFVRGLPDPLVRFYFKSIQCLWYFWSSLKNFLEALPAVDTLIDVSRFAPVFIKV